MATANIFLGFEWFRLFYGIAILTGLILVLRAAARERLPASKVVMAFLWVATFGILFSKLMEWPLASWSDWLAGGEFPGDRGKTALGGLLGGIIGVITVRKILDLGSKTWGWFLHWPVVLILFRAGCLLVGCCIGTPTSLPWGVSYGLDTDAGIHQLVSGQIHHGAACTLPSHPAPVYEMLFAVAALIMISVAGRRGHDARKLFFLSVAAYSGFRFLEEFIRPEHANGDFLNPVQYGLLLAVPLLLFIALRRNSASPAIWLVGKDHLRQLILIGMPFALLWSFRSMWTPAELMGFGMVLLAYGFVRWREWRSNAETSFSPAWATTGSVVMAIALMSQASIDQTITEGYVQSLEMGVGGNYGRYSETCGSNHRYWNAGFGATYRQNFNGKHQVDLGFKANYGLDQSPDEQTSSTIISANPFVEYQHRWIGAHLGLHVGELISDGNRETILPSVGLRLGPSDIFFAEFRALNFGYATVPGTFHVGIGSGFGLKNGTAFRLGISPFGFYAYPSIVVQRDFVIEPIAAYGDNQNYQFGLNLRYKIPLISRK